uniref:Uncharacterized protein n=1 Tax=Anguilla anguilla TaxID=7936 RepID=A0A0E9PA59_ANGAN
MAFYSCIYLSAYGSLGYSPLLNTIQFSL